MKKLFLALALVIGFSSMAFARESYRIIRVSNINPDGSGTVVISFVVDGVTYEESVNVPTKTDASLIESGVYTNQTLKETLIYLDGKAQGYISSKKEEVARNKYANSIAAKFSSLFGKDINFQSDEELSAAIDALIANSQ